MNNVIKISRISLVLFYTSPTVNKSHALDCILVLSDLFPKYFPKKSWALYFFADVTKIAVNAASVGDYFQLRMDTHSVHRDKNLALRHKQIRYVRLLLLRHYLLVDKFIVLLVVFIFSWALLTVKENISLNLSFKSPQLYELC